MSKSAFARAFCTQSLLPHRVADTIVPESSLFLLFFHFLQSFLERLTMNILLTALPHILSPEASRYSILRFIFRVVFIVHLLLVRLVTAHSS